MKADVKAEWVAALRSGDYKQGKSYLHRAIAAPAGETYCCLGVLSELAYRKGVVDRRLGPDGTLFVYGEESTGLLPPEVATWAGLDDNSWPSTVMLNGYVSPRNENHSLVGLNDDGRPFSEIADIIEEYL